MTPANLVSAIQANLTDDRMYGVQLFIEKLLKRTIYGDGIEQYRVKDKVTNTMVTNLADFIAKLDANSLRPDYYYYSDKMEGDRVHPTAVNLSNFEVTLDEHAPEDSIYFSMFGKGSKNILILMNYLSDADPVLPMKIFEIRLLKQG